LAFIYGSIAKQEDTAKSDIDLMIMGGNLNYGDIFKLLAKPEEQLGRKINPTFYSLSDWQSKSSRGNNFINQIKRQPKIFLIGSEGELNELR
jgi:Polymerase beta, Nucleotidyltransferase